MLLQLLKQLMIDSVSAPDADALKRENAHVTHTHVQSANIISLCKPLDTVPAKIA